MDKAIIFRIVYSVLLIPAVYDISKATFLFVKDKLINKSIPTSISGYWYSIVESKRNPNNKTVEFINIKQKGEFVSFNLYQHTYKQEFFYAPISSALSPININRHLVPRVCCVKDHMAAISMLRSISAISRVS